jgi:hypothetical protein
MSNKIDWDLVKFRASSWGNLMTEPKSKEDKEKGELSATCKGELIKIYNQLKYGRKKDITTKHMDKGNRCEPESIAMYSRVMNQYYEKNEVQLENEWFTGNPDIFLGKDIYHAEEVDDIKSRWDLDTFSPKLIEKIDKGEELQLQVYLCLTGAKKGAIVNTLVSAPFEIIEAEKRKLLYSMNVATEIAPEYIEAALELEFNMVFDDISEEERIIRQEVERNDDLIQKMKDKVPVMRKWLSDLDEMHSKKNR